jgi:hypothetical protein
MEELWEVSQICINRLSECTVLFDVAGWEQVTPFWGLVSVCMLNRQRPFWAVSPSRTSSERRSIFQHLWSAIHTFRGRL